jgi:hypothetical protein
VGRPVRQQADAHAIALGYQPRQAEDIYELPASCLVAAFELGIEQLLRPGEVGVAQGADGDCLRAHGRFSHAASSCRTATAISLNVKALSTSAETNRNPRAREPLQ